MNSRALVAAGRATIRISDLALRTVIGINEWERRTPQDVVINISMQFDASAAVASDAVGDTLDYKRVKQAVISLVEQSHFGLLERLCYEVLQKVMAEPRVLAATVRIDKPQALRFARSVSVEMQAERPS